MLSWRTVFLSLKLQNERTSSWFPFLPHSVEWCCFVFCGFQFVFAHWLKHGRGFRESWRWHVNVLYLCYNTVIFFSNVLYTSDPPLYSVGHNKSLWKNMGLLQNRGKTTATLITLRASSYSPLYDIKNQDDLFGQSKQLHTNCIMKVSKVNCMMIKRNKSGKLEE